LSSIAEQARARRGGAVQQPKRDVREQKLEAVICAWHIGACTHAFAVSMAEPANTASASRSNPRSGHTERTTGIADS